MKKSQGHRPKVFNREEGKEEKLARGTETKSTFFGVFNFCVFVYETIHLRLSYFCALVTVILRHHFLATSVTLEEIRVDSQRFQMKTSMLVLLLVLSSTVLHRSKFIV